MPSSKDKNKNKGKDKSKDNNKDKTKDMGKEKSKGKGKEIYKEENQPLTISFTNSEKRSPSVERAVLKYARSDTRPFGHATVRSTPEHTGGQHVA
ncbi:hypothetical protein GQX73_g10424 [Xylaria multiplex]|uniref:Uncharacterized protein n=1 Tax=Xylaria multiplex TaxID=323545 RepID=A0A7C8IJH9_9PEZI|nr:hypothetical protein GQX73_g10424 [Xylaria multiplex]